MRWLELVACCQERCRPPPQPNKECAKSTQPLQGTFDSAVCKCKCQNEEINAAGYCRDPVTGACTVRCLCVCLLWRGGIQRSRLLTRTHPARCICLFVCICGLYGQQGPCPNSD